ncbi:hypothetical protein ANO11243_042770 [Dothideomycetidae sp. 11243]|nr:hypothetical protein ANO11243_042770 [fungal sp. No.11243]
MLRALLAAAALVAHSSATARCYFPDGTTLQGPEFVPCNSFNSTNSYCCGAGRTTNVTADVYPDLCLPNGLCSGGAPESDGTRGMFWREGCSNPDWPEEVCPRNVCSDPSGAPAEISLKPTLVAVATSTSSAASSASATSTTAASTSSLSPTSTGSTAAGTTVAGHSLSSGAKAGIGIGVALGVLIILAAAAFFTLASRKKKRALHAPDQGTVDADAREPSMQYRDEHTEPAWSQTAASPAAPTYAYYADAPAEMDPEGQVHELSTSHNTPLHSQVHQLSDDSMGGKTLGDDEKR